MNVILVSTWSLLRDSFLMAVDAVPTNISLIDIIEVMRKVDKVEDVHHVHVWAISTIENDLTAHVVINEQLPFEEKLHVVQQVKHELKHNNIQHSTIELENRNCDTFCNH